MTDSFFICLFTCLLALLPNLLEAAPRKRSCHSTPYLEPESTAETTQPTSSSLNTISNAVNTEDEQPVVSSDKEPTSTPKLTGTKSSAMAPTITPEVILIYPNSTYTLPSTVSLSLPILMSAPQTTPAAFNNDNSASSSHASTTPSSKSSITPTPTTSSSPTFTTPNIDAMQTAYYVSVCGWPEHADDAICLGGNTMMCCHADNPHCQAILMDGGLSCQGIESGNWATTWTRPTVTLGPDGNIISSTVPSDSSTASAIVRIGNGTETVNIGGATTRARLGSTSTPTTLSAPNSDGARGGATGTTSSSAATNARTGFAVENATTLTNRPVPGPVASDADTNTPTLTQQSTGTNTDTNVSTTTAAAVTSTTLVSTPATLISIIPVNDRV